MKFPDQPVKIVAASGGLIWRLATGGRELIVIHRRRHGDWTLPKGKVQPGESWIQCAIREVREETGFNVEVESPAGWVCYDVGEITKVVRFWNMRPIGDSQFQGSEEVVSVHWLTPQEAVKRLDHEGERLLIRQVSGQCNAMATDS
jgi:8-oxo-dGTP pyrophosphatase MutT (NUDIX family)